MAIPWVKGISQNARNVLPIIQSGVRRGLSSRKIEATIRQAGMPINRGRDILPTMRVLKDLEEKGRRVKYVPKNNRINTNTLPPSITRTRRRYSFRVRINGLSPDGAPLEKLMTFTTDNPDITPAEIEGGMVNALADIDKYEEIEDATATVEFGMQRAEFGDPSIL